MFAHQIPNGWSVGRPVRIVVIENLRPNALASVHGSKAMLSTTQHHAMFLRLILEAIVDTARVIGIAPAFKVDTNPSNR